VYKDCEMAGEITLGPPIAPIAPGHRGTGYTGPLEGQEGLPTEGAEARRRALSGIAVGPGSEGTGNIDNSP
jgi:hypothetical protein